MIRPAALALLLMPFPALAEDITIGTAVPYPRILEHDGAGNVSGLEGDLVAAICARAGWTCTWEVMPFDTLFPALEAGRIDMAANVFGLTAERAARVHMTCPYMPPTADAEGGTFFVTDPAHDPRSGPVAVLRGSLFADTLDGIDADLRLFADEGLAIGALLSGDVPAYFGSATTAMGYPGAAALVNRGQLPTQSRGLSLAVTPTRPGLGAEVDAQLASLSRDGALTYLLNRWINRNVDDPIALCDRQPTTS